MDNQGNFQRIILFFNCVFVPWKFRWASFVQVPGSQDEAFCYFLDSCESQVDPDDRTAGCTSNQPCASSWKCSQPTTGETSFVSANGMAVQHSKSLVPAAGNVTSQPQVRQVLCQPMGRLYTNNQPCASSWKCDRPTTGETSFVSANENAVRPNSHVPAAENVTSQPQVRQFLCQPIGRLYATLNKPYFSSRKCNQPTTGEINFEPANREYSHSISVTSAAWNATTANHRSGIFGFQPIGWLYPQPTLFQQMEIQSANHSWAAFCVSQ
jgi:hypothetical protein